MKVVRKAVFGTRCSECGRVGSYVPPGENRHAAVTLAEQLGWIEEDGETLCPNCAAIKQGIIQLSFFDEVAA